MASPRRQLSVELFVSDPAVGQAGAAIRAGEDLLLGEQLRALPLMLLAVGDVLAIT